MTGEPDVVVPFPEIVAGFEALGWAKLGLVGARLSEEELEATLADYRPRDGQAFRDHHPDVATVLVSPDRTALVDVSWFWDSPSVRITSVTEDGVLVETVREWDHRPRLPRQLRLARLVMDVRKEIERQSVPSGGRSTRPVCAGSLPGEAGARAVVQEHLRHVEEFGGTGTPGGARPVELDRPSGLRRFGTLDDFLEVRRGAYAHSVSVAEAVGRTSRAILWVVTALVVVAVLLSVGVLGSSWLWATALVILALVAVNQVVRPFVLCRVAYLTPVRPPYR